MSKVWIVDNEKAGVSRPGVQRWAIAANGRTLDTSGGVAVSLHKDGRFEKEGPIQVSLQQLDAIGAKADPANPAQRFPGEFAFDPDSGAALKSTALADPDGWTSLCSDDGLPGTPHFSDIELAGQQTFLFPSNCDFAVGGRPPALYAVLSEKGVVYRFCPTLDWSAERQAWGISGPAVSRPEARKAWVRVGKIGASHLPNWCGGMVGGRHVLVAPTGQGPTAIRCPALSDMSAADVVLGAPCVGGAAERPGTNNRREFLIPALQNGRLTLFKRWDDAKAVWRSEVVEGLDGPPPGEVLAAPVMDAARHVYWVGLTGVLIASEDGDGPPVWEHWEPSFRSLRRARPFKSRGVLWQLGQVGEGDKVTLAYRKLGGGRREVRPVANPHFSGGSHTYAAPDMVRRYSTPWDEPEPDDMLKVASADGFLAPLVVFQGAGGAPDRVLALHVASPVSFPFLADEPHAARTNVALRLHEPQQPLSERFEGASLNQITSLDDIVAVIFGGRLFVVNRNHPQEFAPCASWPVSPSL